jgi:hypothetical protein
VNAGHTRTHSSRITAITAFIAALTTCLAFFVGDLSPRALVAGASESADEDVSMSLLSADSTVTSDSGYHAKIAVTNTSGRAIHDASLSIDISTSSIIAASQMQSWADGGSSPSTPTSLEPSKDLTDLSLPNNASTTITVAVPAESYGLSAITTWGAKPVEFSLSWNSDDYHATQLRTFFTRTTDGLHISSTPAMSIIPVMQVTENAWEQNTEKTDTLVTKGFTPENQEEPENQAEQSAASWMTQSSQIVTRAPSAQTAIQNQFQLAYEFPQIQVIAEPSALGTAQKDSTIPQIAAITQPYDFDITGYASSPKLGWKQAGIDESMFSASTAQDLFKSADTDGTDSADDTSAKPPLPIALEGSASWDQASLNLAKKQGYSFVLGDADVSTSVSHAVLTGQETIQTDSGPITMLMNEPVLSTLAQNSATSAEASGENSSAGRIARFVAQSAVYQMQRPYVNRTLLVSLGQNASSPFVTSLMKAINDSSWITPANLDSLITPPSTPKDMQPDTLGSSLGDNAFPLGTRHMSSALTSRYSAALTTLAGNAQTIKELGSNILDDSEQGGKDDSSKNDPQSLARQNANSEDTLLTADEWVSQLNHVHSLLTFLAMSSPQSSESSAATAIDSNVVQQLHSHITVVPPKKVNVMSQTASLLVNVENRLPFPIKVQIFGTTNSNAITMTPSQTVTVPTNSEAQSTLTISVVGSSSAQAQILLADRAGKTFTSVKTTQITAHLTLNDMSGNIILAFAGILTIFGLWRQFTRKKRRKAAQQKAEKTSR